MQMLEVYEIQPANKSKEVPDPFKKRDKIPRSSGSIEQFTNISNSNSNSNSNNSNSSNSSNNNATAPIRHSSVDSQTPIRSRHHPDQVSSPKVKSSNSVGPDADKQLQRLSGGKNLNIEKTNLLVNDVNTSEDDSKIRNAQSSNKKQRSSSKADEFTGEKEKGNLGKVVIPITPNHQSMDLNGKTEMVISNNKKIMTKTILKSRKTSTPTNNENKPISRDGIATPPDTPPISPASTPARSSQTRSENDVTDQMTLEETSLATPLVTPPLSINSNDDVSTQSSSSVTLTPKSRKRRGSHSSQFSSEMPAAKLQTPRSRRSSLASKPTVAAVEQSQEFSLTQLLNKSKEMQMSQQSQQQNPPRSRIPRLSMSSRERPVIAKKESQDSLSQGSNKIDKSNESLSSSYPVTPKLQSSRGLRLATSRPIINTSFVTDIEVTSESPTSYLPTSQSSPISQTSNSPTNHSPTSHSPTDHSTNQRKLTISHDDIIVPTVAKKLKMYGQLPVVNYDALLGYSEEPEIISPTTENGYMDITDQVVDLFDNPKSKPHKKKSDSNSQRRLEQSVRKNSHSRNSSKTHYIAPRKQNHQPAQQTNKDTSNPTITRFERSSNRSTFNDDSRKSRREEYIMVIRDDDDIEFIESHTAVVFISYFIIL
jgi:hypothetical protein